MIDSMRIDLAALPLTVISKREDGSGVVEMPIAVNATIDRALTAGGGSGTVTLGPDEWAGAVRNFPHYRRPVPVYFGHLDDGSREATPAAGFVTSLRYAGDALWATVDLGPDAFGAVVVKRGFRSASVEMSTDLVTPTGSLPGYTLTGLAITNTPALPVEYAIAATNAGLASTAGVRLSVSYEGTAQREQEMSDKLTLEGLQAETIRLEAQVKERDKALAALQESAKRDVAERDALTKQIGDLRIELARSQAEQGASRPRIKELETELDVLKASTTKLTAELSAVRTAQIGERVTALIKLAVSRGADPAQFDGSDDDPAKWLSERFVNVDAFESFIGGMSGNLGKRVSGSPARTGDGDVKLTASEGAVLDRLGIDRKYAGIRSLSDLRAMKAAQKGA